jgi:ComF family protein
MKRESEDFLCSDCNRFVPVQDWVCEKCGDPIPETAKICGECLNQKRHVLDSVRSCLWLDQKALDLLHLIKYQKQKELLFIFKKWIKSFPEFYSSVIIPVPLHFSSWKKRGFNQSEVLASFLSALTFMPVDYCHLIKTAATDSQSTLSRKEREMNLKSAFEWVGKKSPPKKVLLVDDIFTTGSTLRACAGALRKAGVEEVCGWTLFRTPEVGIFK